MSFEAALALNSKNLEARQDLLEVMEALRCDDVVVQHHRQEFLRQDRLAKAMALLQQHNLGDAIDLLDDLTNREECSEAYLLRGLVHRESNQVAEAERDLKKAVQLDPTRTAARLALAEVVSLLGRDCSTICEQYVKALEARPHDSDIWSSYHQFRTIGQESCVPKVISANTQSSSSAFV